MDEVEEGVSVGVRKGLQQRHHGHVLGVYVLNFYQKRKKKKKKIKMNACFFSFHTFK